MPELPEVETTKRGISPHILNHHIKEIKVHDDRLRLKPSPQLIAQQGQKIIAVQRRAKYLLIETEPGYIVIHLGMSGTLRVVENDTAPDKHDHVEIVISNNKVLRYNDPRRFGGVTFIANKDLTVNPLFKKLGPEPLSADFNLDYLTQKLAKRKIAIKKFLMDNAVVVGVGNIYANELLYQLGINPLTYAMDLTKTQVKQLVPAIKEILTKAIEQGGTTLKDFTQPDGRPGYFAQQLQVYGKAGELCPITGGIIESVVIGGRNSFYCLKKQPIQGQAKLDCKDLLSKSAVKK